LIDPISWARILLFLKLTNPSKLLYPTKPTKIILTVFSFQTQAVVNDCPDLRQASGRRSHFRAVRLPPQRRQQNDGNGGEAVDHRLQASLLDDPEMDP